MFVPPRSIEKDLAIDVDATEVAASPGELCRPHFTLAPNADDNIRRSGADHFQNQTSPAMLVHPDQVIGAVFEHRHAAASVHLAVLLEEITVQAPPRL